jgi:hypothetical protein
MNPPRYSGSGVEVRGAMAVIAAARPLDAELRSEMVLEEAERLVAVWNERRAKRMPMLSSPGIGAANRG